MSQTDWLGAGAACLVMVLIIWCTISIWLSEAVEVGDRCGEIESYILVFKVDMFC